MMLVLLLLGLPFALGYEESYVGFNSCGVEGWSCSYLNGKYEITYQCSKSQPNARVWVWTARLPTGSSIFTVRDCNHLEVHMDCTKGMRQNILNQFRVINVNRLEILPPLLPGIFLHDNDAVPQVPPNLYIENVKNVNFFPGLFDKPTGSCRYKFVELNSLSLVNVHVDRFTKDLFHNQNLSRLEMSSVVIDAIDNNGIKINGNAVIRNTIFPHLIANAITLQGENISFVSNSFQKIQPLGLTIRSKNFLFENNRVEEIAMQGFNIWGTQIRITKNVFNHLETGAFQRLTPGYSPSYYEVASRFTYTFSSNTIKNINPGSFHPNWEIYKQVCSDITFENNLFECSCINLGWLSVSNGLGPKISKVKEFYDIYFVKDKNTCSEHNHCSLSTVVSRIQDVCNNKTNVSAICSESEFSKQTDITSSPQDSTMSVINSSPDVVSLYTQQNNPNTEETDIVEKEKPFLYYTENQTSRMGDRTLPIWVIVVPIILVLAAICLGVFWYKRKRARQTVTTIYKNDRSIDADNLIVINEHHNELYDKQ